MARGAGAGAARRLRGRLHMLINISLRHGRRRTAPPEAHPRETPSPWTAPLRMDAWLSGSGFFALYMVRRTLDAIIDAGNEAGPSRSDMAPVSMTPSLTDAPSRSRTCDVMLPRLAPVGLALQPQLKRAALRTAPRAAYLSALTELFQINDSPEPNVSKSKRPVVTPVAGLSPPAPIRLRKVPRPWRMAAPNVLVEAYR